jgi:Na+-driven multidrug efflux pump
MFFVLALDMSVEGVALATLMANAISAVILLRQLSKDEGVCRFSFKKLRLDGLALKQIINIGLPAAVQGSLFSISNMVIQSSILQVNNAMVGSDAAFQPVVKGNSAANNLENFVYTSTNSVYQASITFTSQNAGAAKYERIGRVMRACYLVTFVVAAVMSGALLLFHQPLLSLYQVVPGEAGSLERIAYESAETKMFIMIVPYFLLAFMEVGCGVLRGLGRSVTSTFISLLGACVFRIAWIATAFRAFPTLECIYWSYPISWALTALAQLCVVLVVLRHYIRTRKSREELLASGWHKQ